MSLISDPLPPIRNVTNTALNTVTELFHGLQFSITDFCRGGVLSQTPFLDFSRPSSQT